MAKGVPYILKSNELRAIVKWNYPHTLWQSRLQVGNLLLYCIDHFESVDTVTRDYDATDSFLTILSSAPVRKTSPSFTSATFRT